MDHHCVHKSMLSDDPESVDFSDIVQLKDNVVRAVAEEVSGGLTDARYGAVFVVEPIWYLSPDEDASSPEWKERRIDGVVESAIEADRRGADLLKLEFPGHLGTPEGEGRAVDACEAIDAAVTALWFILSAGVGFEEFTQEMEIAANADCR